MDEFDRDPSVPAPEAPKSRLRRVADFIAREKLAWKLPSTYDPNISVGQAHAIGMALDEKAPDFIPIHDDTIIS